MFDVVQKGNSEIVAFKADLWFVPYLLYYIAMTYLLHIQMLQWLLHIVKTWECGSFHHHLSTSHGQEIGKSEGQGKRQGQTENGEVPKE